jgi:hypothetical protein
MLAICLKYMYIALFTYFLTPADRGGNHNSSRAKDGTKVCRARDYVDIPFMYHTLHPSLNYTLLHSIFLYTLHTAFLPKSLEVDLFPFPCYFHYGEGEDCTGNLQQRVLWCLHC